MECYHCKHCQKGHIKFACLSWYDTDPAKQHKDSHPRDFERAQKIVSQGAAQNSSSKPTKAKSPQERHAPRWPVPVETCQWHKKFHSELQQLEKWEHRCLHCRMFGHINTHCPYPHYICVVCGMIDNGDHSIIKKFPHKTTHMDKWYCNGAPFEE